MAVFLVIFRARFYQPAGLGPSTTAQPDTEQATVLDHETWKGIFINDEKAGYAVSSLQATQTGYASEDSAFFRFNTMGMVQDIKMETSARLKNDFSLESFSLAIHSSLFTFKARGRLEENLFTIHTSGAEDIPRKISIDVESPPFLASGILLDVATRYPSIDPKMEYALFEPLSMEFMPATVQVKGIEPVDISNETVQAIMVELSVAGMTQTLWMDTRGRVLKEAGMLGMTIRAMERQKALSGITSHPEQDLTRLAGVSTKTPITDKESLVQLVIEIGGIDLSDYILDTRRQSVKGKRLTVKKESIPSGPFEKPGPDMAPYLSPGPFVQSDNDDIIDLARSITHDKTSPVEKIMALLTWVYENIEKRPLPSVPDALSTLNTRQGDCNEHAVLLAALGRAAGIPTRIETGLYYQNNLFMYHAWNAFYAGEWVTADAVFNQFPADVTHIRLAESKKGTGIELAGVIGNITIKIVDME